MQSNTNLRRKDTTKGPPLRILSLDGGGVRGFSMLILLQELMHRIYVEVEGKAPRRDQIPKPCDHFDLIAGTGTGGLIAIMLGRLRLDIETCREVYIRMTRYVFETDKTFAGIPYRSTLFKASKLEEAIKECVREHTIFGNEGNDSADLGSGWKAMSPGSPTSQASSGGEPRRKLSRTGGRGRSGTHRPAGSGQWGNPNALLYDIRENRTKTAVTAVYKGTPKNGSATLLRSYDSRKEPPPEFNCTIWQAGRATSATGLAFKPIQIGQSVFHDEGSGKYNPAPQVLDEATVNEWPGRDVGVFVSIGTGKRPSGTNHEQHLWWEGFVSGGIGDFAEARRTLISKIEGCEDTHQYMLREHLLKRGVNVENYYRYNVEVGVGDFGMNEWNRLADISTGTSRYVRRNEIQYSMEEAAGKMGKIHRSRVRHGVHMVGGEIDSRERPLPGLPASPNPLAVELQGSEVLPNSTPQRPGPPYPPQYQLHLNSPADKYTVISSDEFPQPVDSVPDERPNDTPARRSNDPSPRRSNEHQPSGRTSNDHNAPPQALNASLSPSPRRSGENSPRRSNDRSDQSRPIPPPLPPKTPLPYPDERESRRVNSGRPVIKLPYPENDGPPPVVNLARKPEYGGR
ncbi:hypothetical protein FGG08_004940 [Glutinoglossum americanum]|uniref:PNPLA domain-containing protein n=1 Tax=Glutinoglossum americanum TaxID=1670608 RepID=A0A9P8HZ91_9PEZI|nr:hypothetical protein FGG08_004940 [Glutinoglossum americanum]